MTSKNENGVVKQKVGWNSDLVNRGYPAKSLILDQSQKWHLDNPYRSERKHAVEIKDVNDSDPIKELGLAQMVHQEFKPRKSRSTKSAPQICLEL